MGKNLEITEKLEKYIEEHSYSLHPIQKEIILHNKKLGNNKKMQIAVSQCHFLELIIKISNTNRILEIGTFTGLSTLSMSLALPKEGSLIALDKNIVTNETAIDFFKKANQDKKIKTIVKPALESLVELKKKNNIFDIVFIDADKENYIKYYDNSVELVKKNGLIIIDNVLWHGEVVDKENDDKFTNIIRKFNIHVKNDKKTEQVILPLGDGFTVSRKL
ncbi:MAG TPA: SAM-dependent methyltransferase [Candidatus Pelagibacter sp.]|jgi:predicted O-methyltransferase YrrM|nr:SAM-dependent methyltransferase [Candidatus Pelagibacter sp.]